MNEHKEPRKKEYQPPRFLELVLSVGAGALQALGLGIASEADEKEEPNLELARYSIDMIQLLKEKTKGNLEKEEERFLENMLHQLRLRYVEVAKQSKEAE
jgi:hypothetical protein